MTYDSGFRALGWSIAGTSFRLVVQFVVQVLLARILGPSEYGLFALSIVVVGFFAMFADAGLAYGFVQQARPSESSIRFAFTWQLLLGLAVTLLLLFFSSNIASWLGEPQLAQLIAWLSPICIINAVMTPAKYLLAGALDQRRLQRGLFFAYVVGYVGCGIPLALLGLSAAALVAASLVQSVAGALILYRQCRHPTKLLLWYEDGLNHLRMGLAVVFAAFSNWCSFNLDRLIVGRLFPAREVGVYANAYGLLQTPAMAFAGAVQPVIHAGLARLSDDRQHLSVAYQGMIGLTIVFVFPLFASVSVFADEITLTLYGGAWAGSGKLLRWMAIAMPWLIVFVFTTPVIWIHRRGASEAWLQLPLLIFWGLTLLAFGDLGAEFVAQTLIVVFACRALLMVAVTMNALDLPLRGMLNGIRFSVSIAIVGASFSIICGVLARIFVANTTLRFGVFLLLGIVLSCAPLLIPKSWHDPPAARWLIETSRRLTLHTKRLLSRTTNDG